MEKIKNEIFEYFPCEVEVPDEVMKKAEEIRVRLRTSYFGKVL